MAASRTYRATGKDSEMNSTTLGIDTSASALIETARRVLADHPRIWLVILEATTDSGIVQLAEITQEGVTWSHPEGAQWEAEDLARQFAARYPTPNVLRGIDLAEQGRVSWVALADLFARSYGDARQQVAE